ncbi:heterokaryon incompatibility protein [Colletotrichum asianum]|uniref:Heterokaryon incompatibility protein n=1 Tax=Colletotrichum asianum TaxID=702518 RepID=A0A8H3ZM54_9PEZI|nr:heterokaryon incompatibility protein [Colletotrichum asianum]
MPPVRRRESDPEYPALFWWHLYQIIGHQWWSRSWVYQEFIVGSQVIFLFSEEYWMSWGKLHCLLSFFLQQDTVQACEEIIALRRRADETSQRCGPFMNEEPIMNNLHKARVSGACFLTAAARSIPYVLGYGYFHLPACPGYELLRTKKSWGRISSEGLEMHLEHLPIWKRDQALVTRVIQGKQRWQDSGSQLQLDLSYLLNHARNTKSSQPKDRIYAFVGLSTLRNKIQINYDPAYSINMLLADVARTIVLYEDEGLDILSQAGTAAYSRALPRGSDPLPTWVPDWDEREVFQRDRFIKGLDLPPNSAAGKRLEKSMSFSADRFGNAGRVLEVAGTRIGKLGMLVETGRDDFGPWRSFSGVETGSRIMTTNVAQPGDEVWVLHGMSWPVVLRRSSVADNTTFLAVAMMWEGERPHQIMSGSGVVGEVGRVVVTQAKERMTESPVSCLYFSLLTVLWQCLFKPLTQKS